MYLGLPELVIGSKVAALKYIDDRVDRKINSWTNQFLTPGGKEVLLKAEITGLATHSMTCFKLPKTLCQKIENKMAAFWWQNNSERRGIHWKSWSKLCAPKEKGGLGFKDLEGQNLALLAKQLWRMLEKPDSLAAKVFKGKYFHRSNPLDAKLGSRPSYAWRSLHEAQPLLKIGIRKLFGNGQGINMLHDPWLPTLPPRAPKPKEGVTSADFGASDLLIPGTYEWNIPVLESLFPHEEIQLILQVKPSTVSSNSSYTWNFNADGCYTVKSGYWVWSEWLREKENGVQGDSQPSFDVIHNLIWRSKTFPKVQHFLWKCLTNSLATMENLARRKMRVNDVCARCGSASESVNHILFMCPYARLVWACSPLMGLFYPKASDSLYENLYQCLQDKGEARDEHREHLYLAPWILWEIWKSRNELSFTAKDERAQEIIEKARRHETDWRHAQEEEIQKPQSAPPLVPQKWTPPPQGTLKCNVDASWRRDSDHCDVGWILRDDKGVVRWLGTKRLPRLLNSLEAEATSLVWAMQCMENFSMGSVIFESDSRNLIEAITTPEKWPVLRQYILEIQRRRRFLEPEFTFRGRNGNHAADAIVKHYSNSSASIYASSISCCLPSWLSPFVLTDQLGL